MASDEEIGSKQEQVKYNDLKSTKWHSLQRSAQTWEAKVLETGVY